jgi:uncharacterized protein DUF262
MTTNGGYTSMKYVNREMKIDQIISYFNQHKINLIPPFQRGTVWKLADRQKLLVNMVQARPIPAVFLYKQPEGAQFAYNILDGKQRLESLILFVGDKRQDLRIENIGNYFFKKPAAKSANFGIKLEGDNEITFADLDDSSVAAFREYVIPTIEIDLDDETTSIDEVVNLFIDINQQGVKVSRFDVVKALGKDPLFKQIFDLIAVKETRKKKSVYFKAKKSSFVYVMKRLNIVSRLNDRNSQVDRMWERLTEIALFSRSGKHRAPSAILKSFIRAGDELNPRLSTAELSKLRRTFEFLAGAYRGHKELMESKLATDQPQFYTLITTLLSDALLERYDHPELARRIAEVSQIIDGKKRPMRGTRKLLDEFQELSTKQTTNPARRDRRQVILTQAIDTLEPNDEQVEQNQSE